MTPQLLAELLGARTGHDDLIQLERIGDELEALLERRSRLQGHVGRLRPVADQPHGQLDWLALRAGAGNDQAIVAIPPGPHLRVQIGDRNADIPERLTLRAGHPPGNRRLLLSDRPARQERQHPNECAARQ